MTTPPLGPIARRRAGLPAPEPKPEAPVQRKPAWIERRDAGLLPGKVLS